MAVVLPGLMSAGRTPHPVDTPSASVAPLALTGIEDGRGRFREIYCAIRARSAKSPEDGASCENELVRLADEPTLSHGAVRLDSARLRMRVLVVPGLYGDCLPVTPFSDALPRLEELGHETGVIDIGGFSSVSANAARIRDAILALAPDPDETLVVVGYSKGVPDLMQALVAYPEVRQRVKAMVSVAGVVSGTPLADRVGSSRLLAPLAHLSARLCPERDHAALTDLGRSARLDWLSRNRLPDSVRYYSLIALSERDRVPRAFRAGYDILAKVDPRNDGAVIGSDAIVPGSKLLGFVRADHWAIALPFSRDMQSASALGLTRNEFPREALLEAVVRTVEEDLSGAAPNPRRLECGNPSTSTQQGDEP